MTRLIPTLAGALALIPVQATAQPAPIPPATTQAAPSAGDTLSLSDAEKAELLGHDTEASVDAARAGFGGAPDHAIHGEIGVLAGTHGTRAAYGTAAIPLGDSARATVSFESSREDRRY